MIEIIQDTMLKLRMTIKFRITVKKIFPSMTIYNLYPL